MKKMMCVFILILLVGCTETPDESFDFSLRYGCENGDWISTYDNELIVETVEGRLTVDFKFTPEELLQIKEKIDSLGLLELEFKGFPKTDLIIHPLATYNFKITLDDQVYRYYWTTNNYPEFDMKQPGVIDETFQESYNKIKVADELVEFINAIIINSETYKKLPKHVMYQ